MMNQVNSVETSKNQQRVGVQTAVPISASEFERESEAVEANLSYMEERLQVLERRLMPVLAQNPDEDSDVGKSSSLPQSPIGGQLRSYSNRVENVAARLQNLLNQLALP